MCGGGGLGAPSRSARPRTSRSNAVRPSDVAAGFPPPPLPSPAAAAAAASAPPPLAAPSSLPPRSTATAAAAASSPFPPCRCSMTGATAAATASCPSPSPAGASSAIAPFLPKQQPATRWIQRPTRLLLRLLVSRPCGASPDESLVAIALLSCLSLFGGGADATMRRWDGWCVCVSAWELSRARDAIKPPSSSRKTAVWWWGTRPYRQLSKPVGMCTPPHAAALSRRRSVGSRKAQRPRKGQWRRPQVNFTPRVV